MKAFLFASNNEFKGKFNLTSEENLPQAFQEYSSKNAIAPFDYIEWSGKTWTILRENTGYALAQGRVTKNQVDLTRQAEEAQRQAEEEELIRQAEEAALGDSIETLRTGNPNDLNYSQLKALIENHLLFPQLEENKDSEVYRLREKLYMLSLWHPNLQTVIQTRILSDKLDAIQMAITGVANTQAGIANDQTKRHKTSMLGQVAAVAALGKIAQDTQEVSEFFAD